MLLNKKEKTASQLLVFLNCLSVSIEFSRLSLAEIIKDFSLQKSMAELTFLSDCIRFIKGGADFPDAWCQSIEGFQLISSREKERLSALGLQLGSTDVSGQLSTIKLYDCFFQQYYSKVRTQKEKFATVIPLTAFVLCAAVFICLI